MSTGYHGKEKGHKITSEEDSEIRYNSLNSRSSNGKWKQEMNEKHLEARKHRIGYEGQEQEKNQRFRQVTSN